MPSPSLRPCPLCGGEASFSGSQDDEMAFFGCDTIGCSMAGPEGDPTGAKWNELCLLVELGRKVGALPPRRPDVHTG